MRKSELIREASRRSGLNHEKALRGVEATLDIIKHRLATDSIRIRGLGRLEVRPKRRGMLPGSISGESSRPIPAGRGGGVRGTPGALCKMNFRPATRRGQEAKRVENK